MARSMSGARAAAVATLVLAHAASGAGVLRHSAVMPDGRNHTKVTLGTKLSQEQDGHLIGDPHTRSSVGQFLAVLRDAPGKIETIQDFILLDLKECVLVILLWGSITTLCAFYFHKMRALPEADPNLANEAERNSLANWKVGICNCFEDPAVFCMSLCCPAIRWAHTMSLVKILTFWSAFAVFFGCSMINAVTAGTFFWIVMAALGAHYRSNLRKIFGMDMTGFRTLALDFLLYLCCIPCVISQEAQHVRAAAACGHKAIDREALKSDGISA